MTTRIIGGREVAVDPDRPTQPLESDQDGQPNQPAGDRKAQSDYQERKAAYDRRQAQARQAYLSAVAAAKRLERQGEYRRAENLRRREYAKWQQVVGEEQPRPPGQQIVGGERPPAPLPPPPPGGDGDGEPREDPGALNRYKQFEGRLPPGVKLADLGPGTHEFGDYSVTVTDQERGGVSQLTGRAYDISYKGRKITSVFDRDKARDGADRVIKSYDRHADVRSGTAREFNREQVAAIQSFDPDFDPYRNAADRDAYAERLAQYQARVKEAYDAYNAAIKTGSPDTIREATNAYRGLKVGGEGGYRDFGAIADQGIAQAERHQAIAEWQSRGEALAKRAEASQQTGEAVDWAEYNAWRESRPADAPTDYLGKVQQYLLSVDAGNRERRSQAERLAEARAKAADQREAERIRQAAEREAARRRAEAADHREAEARRQAAEREAARQAELARQAYVKARDETLLGQGVNPDDLDDDQADKTYQAIVEGQRKNYDRAALNAVARLERQGVDAEDLTAPEILTLDRDTRLGRREGEDRAAQADQRQAALDAVADLERQGVDAEDLTAPEILTLDRDTRLGRREGEDRAAQADQRQAALDAVADLERQGVDAEDLTAPEIRQLSTDTRQAAIDSAIRERNAYAGEAARRLARRGYEVPTDPQAVIDLDRRIEQAEYRANVATRRAWTQRNLGATIDAEERADEAEYAALVALQENPELREPLAVGGLTFRPGEAYDPAKVEQAFADLDAMPPSPAKDRAIRYLLALEAAEQRRVERTLGRSRYVSRPEAFTQLGVWGLTAGTLIASRSPGAAARTAALGGGFSGAASRAFAATEVPGGRKVFGPSWLPIHERELSVAAARRAALDWRSPGLTPGATLYGAAGGVAGTGAAGLAVRGVRRFGGAAAAQGYRGAAIRGTAGTAGGQAATDAPEVVIPRAGEGWWVVTPREREQLLYSVGLDAGAAGAARTWGIGRRVTGREFDPYGQPYAAQQPAMEILERARGTRAELTSIEQKRAAASRYLRSEENLGSSLTDPEVGRNMGIIEAGIDLPAIREDIRTAQNYALQNPAWRGRIIIGPRTGVPIRVPWTAQQTYRAPVMMHASPQAGAFADRPGMIYSRPDERPTTESYLFTDNRPTTRFYLDTAFASARTGVDRPAVLLVPSAYAAPAQKSFGMTEEISEAIVTGDPALRPGQTPGEAIRTTGIPLGEVVERIPIGAHPVTGTRGVALRMGNPETTPRISRARLAAAQSRAMLERITGLQREVEVLPPEMARRGVEIPSGNEARLEPGHPYAQNPRTGEYLTRPPELPDLDSRRRRLLTEEELAALAERPRRRLQPEMRPAPPRVMGRLPAADAVAGTERAPLAAGEPEPGSRLPGALPEPEPEPRLTPAPAESTLPRILPAPAPETPAVRPQSLPPDYDIPVRPALPPAESAPPERLPIMPPDYAAASRPPAAMAGDAAARGLPPDYAAEGRQTGVPAAPPPPPPPALADLPPLEPPPETPATAGIPGLPDIPRTEPLPGQPPRSDRNQSEPDAGSITNLRVQQNGRGYPKLISWDSDTRHFYDLQTGQHTVAPLSRRNLKTASVVETSDKLPPEIERIVNNSKIRTDRQGRVSMQAVGPQTNGAGLRARRGRGIRNWLDDQDDDRVQSILLSAR